MSNLIEEKVVVDHPEELDDVRKETRASEIEFNDAETKRLLKKVGFWLLPVLTILHLLSFLDRSNVGNARVAGLDTDLGLSDQQCNMCLTIFFLPYALFEVPSNIVLKFLTPRMSLTIIAFAWGAAMTLIGIVQNYDGLLAARFFLGVTEAGLFPAASFPLTIFNCRHEMQTRLAVFYCAATIAGAFSGLLAFALQKMVGIGGLEGWRWRRRIFLIKILITVAFGFHMPWIMLDSLEKCEFFTPEERDYYCQRLKLDYATGGKDGEGFQWKSLRQALNDWKIFLSVVTFWGNTITGYGTAPHYPIYALALIVVFVCSVWSDKAKKRSPFIIYPYLGCAIGFIILVALPKDRWPGARYGMLFIVAAGLYTPLCSIVTWNANNLSGSLKRAIGMALQITIGNLGGAVGNVTYLARGTPYYWNGFGVSLAILVASIASGIALKLLLARSNEKRAAVSEEEVYAKYSMQELSDLGDMSPLYRYTL